MWAWLVAELVSLGHRDHPTQVGVGLPPPSMWVSSSMEGWASSPVVVTSVG